MIDIKKIVMKFSAEKKAVNVKNHKCGVLCMDL